MQLYVTSVSPVTLTVQLACAAKKLNPEVINLANSEHRLPKGVQELPALSHEDIWLTQPLAMIEYLEEVEATNPLYPTNVPLRASIRNFVHIIFRDLMHWEHNLSSRYMEQELGLDEGTQRDWLMLCLKEGFARLEHLLATQARTGTYCFGEQLTLADIALLPQVVFARQAGLSLAAYPHIGRICDNCLELEWCRLVLGGQ